MWSQTNLDTLYSLIEKNSIFYICSLFQMFTRLGKNPSKWPFGLSPSLVNKTSTKIPFGSSSSGPHKNRFFCQTIFFLSKSGKNQNICEAKLRFGNREEKNNFLHWMCFCWFYTCGKNPSKWPFGRQSLHALVKIKTAKSHFSALVPTTNRFFCQKSLKKWWK